MSDLAALLTPALFTAVFKLKICWPKDAPPNARTRGVGAGTADEWRAVCWDVLVELSRMELDSIPDLMRFLPRPEAREFPEQALGLVLLLDQAPRAVFNGVDSRWTNSFFDPLALRVSQQLLALPAAQRIDNPARFVDDLGYPFQHWAMACIWIAAPFAHAEDMAAQSVQTEIMETMRTAVEKWSGAQDPYRSQHMASSDDALAFARLAMGGPPDSDLLQDYLFWFSLVFDAHPPIIRTFGRYPYRNGSNGRDSTAAEQEYLEKTNHLFEADAETAAKIKADVEAGRWTPLER